MSKKKGKSQAALEFLITYGWAFLIILVMIGALAHFGVLDPAKYIPESCIAQYPFECVGAIYHDELDGAVQNIAINDKGLILILKAIESVSIKVDINQAEFWENMVIDTTCTLGQHPAQFFSIWNTIENKDGNESRLFANNAVLIPAPEGNPRASEIGNTNAGAMFFNAGDTIHIIIECSGGAIQPTSNFHIPLTYQLSNKQLDGTAIIQGRTKLVEKGISSDDSSPKRLYIPNVYEFAFAD